MLSEYELPRQDLTGTILSPADMARFVPIMVGIPQREVTSEIPLLENPAMAVDNREQILPECGE